MRHEAQLRELVARVIARLAERLGATGKKGPLIVVFTGATVGFAEAVQQVQNLILDGFRIQLIFSEAARKLLSKAVTDQMEGFPHITLVEESSWLGTLREARAVVVPLLSLNTLSKLSLLIADNLATNLILHGLLMGKPVVMAQNGADPTVAGRQDLGFHKGNSALTRAMVQRLRQVAEYGCVMTDVSELGNTVSFLLLHQEASRDAPGESPALPFSPVVSTPRRFITAAEVLHARRTGMALDPGAAAGMTPLARELAIRHGVGLKSNLLD